MPKIFLIFSRWKRYILICFLVMVATSARADQVSHQFKEGETLWFLAQVYYDSGWEFKRLLKANHLSSAAKLQLGQNLIVPEPRFRPSDSGFEARYNRLFSERNIKIQSQLSPKDKQFSPEKKIEDLLRQAGVMKPSDQ